MPAVHHVEKRATFKAVNHYQVSMIVLPIVFFAIATVTVALRLKVRRMSKAKLTIDDYLCILSLVSILRSPFHTCQYLLTISAAGLLYGRPPHLHGLRDGPGNANVLHFDKTPRSLPDMDKGTFPHLVFLFASTYRK